MAADPDGPDEPVGDLTAADEEEARDTRQATLDDLETEICHAIEMCCHDVRYVWSLRQPTADDLQAVHSQLAAFQDTLRRAFRE